MSKKKHLDETTENPGLYFVQKPESESAWTEVAIQADPPKEPLTPKIDPPRDVALVTAVIFARVSGYRPHKVAGFLAYAKRLQLAPRPVSEWHILYQKYLQEPVTA